MWFYYVFQFLSFVLIPLINMALRAFGIGVTTYVGINFVINVAKERLLNNFSALPSQIQQVLGLAQADVIVNILLSAVLTRLVITGVNKLNGRRKKYGVLEA